MIKSITSVLDFLARFHFDLLSYFPFIGEVLIMIKWQKGLIWRDSILLEREKFGTKV